MGDFLKTIKMQKKNVYDKTRYTLGVFVMSANIKIDLFAVEIERVVVDAPDNTNESFVIVASVTVKGANNPMFTTMNIRV